MERTRQAAVRQAPEQYCLAQYLQVWKSLVTLAAIVTRRNGSNMNLWGREKSAKLAPYP
jgi:hypothetical protein